MTRCCRRCPLQEQAAARVQVAEQLAALGAAPARVAHQLLAAGQPARAIPFVIPAVETAGALGAYRDALSLVDAVLGSSTGEARGLLMARRGDLLIALGDPGAVAAYLAAVPVTTGTQHRLVRARLARAACFADELETAAAALAGLDLEEDAADGPILLARGNLAYFSGDVDAAWDAVGTARGLLLTPDDPWHVRRHDRPAGAHRAPAGRVVRALPHRAAPHPWEAGPRHRPVRRAPVCRGVPPLRPDPVRRGDGARRGAPAAGSTGRGAAGRGLRHVADRRGRVADGGPGACRA